MRRLTSTARRGILRRPRTRDRGAAAAWVGIIAVPVLVIAALGIDVGTMHVAQQRLQTGADAAALAAAADCGAGACLPLTADIAAQQLATANAPLDGAADATILELDRDGRYVEVQVSSETEHTFGPVVGIDSTPQTATAAATWGYPTEGRVVLPIAISWCELAGSAGLSLVRDLVGGVVGVNLPLGPLDEPIHFAGASVSICLGPLLNAVTKRIPGGFRWLDLPAGSGCSQSAVEVGVWRGSHTRPNLPPGCTNADFSAYVGQTVYIPVYSDVRALDAVARTGEIRIEAFVAFRMTGYNLASGAVYRNPCTLSRCIDGEFELGLDLSVGSQPPGDFEYGEGTGVSVGEPAVQLVLPEEGRP